MKHGSGYFIKRSNKTYGGCVDIIDSIPYLKAWLCIQYAW